MPVYIILFRGVGGATQLPVKPLREKLTEAGFGNVATYINSGNAVVKSRLGRERVISTIAAICAKEFHFHKEVYAPAAAEWRALIDNNPFPEAVATPTSLHAAVLAGKPKLEAVEAIRSFAVGDERIEIVGEVAYLHTPHGFGPSKMATMFDKKIGVPNTARNWNTVTKLMAMAEAAA